MENSSTSDSANEERTKLLPKRSETLSNRKNKTGISKAPSSITYNRPADTGDATKMKEIFFYKTSIYKNGERAANLLIKSKYLKEMHTIDEIVDEGYISFYEAHGSTDDIERFDIQERPSHEFHLGNEYVVKCWRLNFLGKCV